MRSSGGGSGIFESSPQLNVCAAGDGDGSADALITPAAIIAATLKFKSFLLISVAAR
jgi:hypothetical protein